MTDTPKIDFAKPEGYQKLSDFGKDALYLINLIKTTYPKLYEKIPDFDRQSDEFFKNVSAANCEKKFDIQLKKFIAVLNDGHTSFDLDFNKYDKQKFNLFLYREKESWILANIDKRIDSGMIGGKAIAINDKPLVEIEARIRAFENGENDEWKFHQFQSHVPFPTYWQAIGVLNENENRLTITIKKDDGQVERFSLTAGQKAETYLVKTKKQKFPFRFKQNEGFYNYFDKEHDFAYLQMNTSLDLVSIKDGIDNYTNAFTRSLAMIGLKKYTKDARDFGAFVSNFFSTVNKMDIKNIILDLSYNMGGDERTGKQFIWYLAGNDGVKGFEETVKVSDYFKIQVKDDWEEYNRLYLKKYGTGLPYGELNVTQEFYKGSYFSDFTKENSPYYLNSSIPKFEGKVYVIISPLTFSAAQVLATTMSDNKLATVLGSLTGNKPTTQTGASRFKLPHTKKIISMSYTYFERPDKSKDSQNALVPDYYFQKTFKELLNGEDALMEYIQADIKNNSRQLKVR